VEVMGSEELLERLVLALEVVVAEGRRGVARPWPANLLTVGGKVDLTVARSGLEEKTGLATGLWLAHPGPGPRAGHRAAEIDKEGCAGGRREEIKRISCMRAQLNAVPPRRFRGDRCNLLAVVTASTLVAVRMRPSR